MLIHYRKLLPILIHASPILIHALPILVHWLGLRHHALPVLIHCPTIPYLNTLSRTIPYFITLSWTIPYLNTLSRLQPACAQNRRIVGSQSESSTKKPSKFVSVSASSITSPESSANQNRVLHHSAAKQIRVLRNTSRQPIRIEYYATRELSARVEDPSRFSAPLGSL